VLFAFVPPAADAHTHFESSSPVPGAEVQRSPVLVTLRFDDDAQIGVLRVVDDAGVNHVVGAPDHPGGTLNVIEAHTSRLARGRYIVDWQVVADDGHVSSGRFAFGVGVAAGPVPPAVAPAVPGEAVAVAVLRFLLFAGLLAGVGLALGAWLVVPPPHVAPLSMVEFAAWLVVAFVAFVDLFVQTVVTSGTIDSVMSSRYGVLHITLTLAALLAVIAVRSGRRNWELLVTAMIVAVLSESLSGHGATGTQPVAGVIFDAAHLVAAATWIGVLLTTLIAPDVVDVRRTSNVATWAVALLLATAVVQVIRNVSTWGALVTTPYGLEICAKIVLFAIAGAIALRSRRRVNEGAVFVARTVRYEMLALTVVIAVTALLVDGQPPR
jgi:copper transport protein